MTGQQTKAKRKRLFVDNQVQGSLVHQLLVHWALACFLIFLYLFTLEAFSNGFSLSLQSNLAALWQEYGLLALVLLVISPVFIYDSVRLSNRFVGPMVSFRRNLRELASGKDVGPISFRQNDFWKDLATDLNSVSEELQTLRQAVGARAAIPADTKDATSKSDTEADSNQEYVVTE